MKGPFRGQIEATMKAENEEFSDRIHSRDARQALVSFLEWYAPKHDRSVA
jgi:predicted transcriptional regulator YdeE